MAINTTKKDGGNKNGEILLSEAANNVSAAGAGNGSGGNAAGSSANKTASSGAAIHAGEESTVQNYGEGTLSMDTNGRITRTMDGTGRSFYVDPGDPKYQSILNEYKERTGYRSYNDYIEDFPEYDDAGEVEALRGMVEEMVELYKNQTPYQPVDAGQYTKNVTTYEEALSLAEQLLAPKYDSMYQQAATAAAQNLERSGLYDTLYGQALAAAQANAVSNAKQEAINNLGIELTNRDRDWARQLLSYAIDENQFAYSAYQDNRNALSNVLMNTINTLVKQAADRNDYNLQLRALALQDRAYVLETRKLAGEISKAEQERQLRELQMEAQDLNNQLLAKQLAML
ncbi:MAG: hypothetical protein K6B40_05260 [Firmicutes bacterium]|nr:hypothetical protein [Bacillota bacterium]